MLVKIILDPHMCNIYLAEVRKIPKDPRYDLSSIAAALLPRQKQFLWNYGYIWPVQ